MSLASQGKAIIIAFITLLGSLCLLCNMSHIKACIIAIELGKQCLGMAMGYLDKTAQSNNKINHVANNHMQQIVCCVPCQNQNLPLTNYSYVKLIIMTLK